MTKFVKKKSNFVAKAVRLKRFQIKEATTFVWLVASVEMILMFLESLWSELSKNVYFYQLLIYSFWLTVLSFKLCRDTQKQTVNPSPPPPPPLSTTIDGGSEFKSVGASWKARGWRHRNDKIWGEKGRFCKNLAKTGRLSHTPVRCPWEPGHHVLED